MCCGNVNGWELNETGIRIEQNGTIHRMEQNRKHTEFK